MVRAKQLPQAWLPGIPVCAWAKAVSARSGAFWALPMELFPLQWTEISLERYKHGWEVEDQRETVTVGVVQVRS